MSKDNEIRWMTAIELAGKIRSKELSPVEVCEAILGAMEQDEPKIHAFITPDPEGARKAAKEAEAAIQNGDDLGPIHGVPVSVKDLFPVKGLPATYGTKFMEHNIAEFDTPATRRLREAGGVILGKTNTPAWGHKDMSDNLVGEAARNPWKLDRTAGGSSGGAAAAAAAGFGPLALGSDGAGSIRIPAALCGVFGLKPSLGRVPYSPNTDYWGARSHIGPMSRTVADSALMLSIMAGPDPADPLSYHGDQVDFLANLERDLSGLKVAWSPDLGYAAVDPEVRALTATAAKRFEDLGCKIEEVTSPWTNPHDWHEILYEGTIAAKQVQRYAEKPEWFDKSLADVIERGRNITLPQYMAAVDARSKFYEEATAFMQQYDLFLTPTMPCGAWQYDGTVTEIDGKPTPSMLHRLPFTYPINATGWPSAAVPCGFTSEGLPVSLQITTNWRDDLLCLQASAAFEKVQPWTQHYPEL